MLSAVALRQKRESAASSVARSFSPSRPAEDTEISGGVPVDLENTTNVFSPQLDANVFHLQASEASNFSVSTDHANVILVIQPSEALPMMGVVDIMVLAGSISVLGVEMTSQRISHTVFSPRSHPTPYIVGVTPKSTSVLAHDIPQRVRDNAPSDAAIILLQESKTGVESLGHICRAFDGLFGDVKSAGSWGVSGFYAGVDGLPPGSRPFVLPESWQAALDSAQSLPSHIETDTPFIGLVYGAKGAGKSTFARTLLNRLLSTHAKVAFLECDIGQSEFTPGGLVSLHVLDRPVFGPSFTHIRPPFRAHFIGSSTPRSSPSHYLSCITALVNAYRLEVQYTLVSEDGTVRSVPLVINTQGWVKGLGADLLSKIEEVAVPTHVYSFQPPELPHDTDPISQSIPFSIHPRSSSTVFTLSSLSPQLTSIKYTPSDLRGLSLMSYFHSTYPALSSTSWSTTVPLNARPPWEIDCSVALDSIILSGPGGEDVVPEELARALNVGLVGLVRMTESVPPVSRREPQPPQPHSFSFPYTQGTPPPSPEISECVGIGLIRSVSKTSATLHLVTPVSGDVLSGCRVLVKGEMELPIWGMLDYWADEDAKDLCGVEWGKVPYLKWGGGGSGVGSAKRRTRKNVMRRGQM